MGGWALPSAAVAFWAGLLLWQARPPFVAGFPAWVWLALGIAGLIGAAIAAPGRRGPDPLHRIGLGSEERPAVAAVASGAPDPRRGPLAALLLMCVGLTLIGAGWGGVADLRREGALLARLAPARVEVVGTLKEDPSLGTYGWHAVFDAGRVSWSGGQAAVRESVWVGGDGDPPAAVRGDQLQIEGTLERPDDAEFAEALRRKGMAVALRADEVVQLGGSPNPLISATQVFRAFVGRSIQRIFPPREAGLLLGLVMGDDSQLDPATSRDFQATGLGHLLVVSGENVAMILAPVMALAVALGLARLGRFLLGLGTVVFFVVLTGAEPSVLRAGVMATLALIGIVLAKPRSTAVVLAGAVLVLLVLDPWLVWSIGFQLSVVATAGMVALATPLAGRFGRFLPKPVALAAGTTIAAQLGVTPLLLFHFHEVPGVTIAANLAAFPAVSPALLLGIAASVLGLAFQPLGMFVGLLARLPMRYLELVANVLAKAPVFHITTHGGIEVLVLGGALFVATALALRHGWRPRRPVVIAAAAVFPLFVWSTALTAGPPGGLTVRFFDVGQGDSALITTAAGATILVDGGPDEEQVATELAALGVKRLDVVVASHSHADHIVGLPNVLARIPVGVVLQPGCPDTGALQADLDAAIADEGLRVLNPRAGDAFVVADVRIDVLSPDRCWVNTESDANNDALVLRVTYGGDVVLLATEPEEPAQELLLQTGADLHADVLKVPHHGAATSVPEFFQAVDADVAVVSVGENDYGHPVPATLDAIAQTGAGIWRTDQHGTITVTFDANGPVVTAPR